MHTSESESKDIRTEGLLNLPSAFVFDKKYEGNLPSNRKWVIKRFWCLALNKSGIQTDQGMLN